MKKANDKLMNKPRIIRLSKQEKLTLKNSGDLCFFWVGSGSAFSKKFFQSNLLIIKGNDHILIDCGTRCPEALHLYGCPITKIRAYLITHSHADHIGGLEEAALMNRYVTKNKPEIIITEDYEELLWHFSLKGGCAFNERHQGNILEFKDLFNSVRPSKLFDKPRLTYEIEYKNINIKMFRTKHIPDNAKSWRDSFTSFGILVDERVMFTSDTRFDSNLITDFIQKYPSIECIFHDCQLFPGGVHASYEELKSFPEEIKNMIYLVHYGDNYLEFDASQDGFAGFTQQGSYYFFE